MKRARFIAASVAGACIATGARAAAASPPAFLLADRIRPGTSLSLAEMLASYPPPVSGDLLQYELGFGAAYDKQIGFGDEIDAEGTGRYLFVESQVGNGDHACNPNTLKKVYLKSHTFADVFTPYPALTYVTRSGNMMTRWGDGVGPSASDLLLLDSKALYDPRRAAITHVGAESLRVDGKAIATTHVRALFAGASARQLNRVDVWLSPAVPLGLVKMTATSPDVEPFHLSVYKFARHFKTDLAMTLRTVRALTPTGDAPVIEN